MSDQPCKVAVYTTITRNPTELAMLDKLWSGEKAFKAGVERQDEAEFYLYDDGWRCESRSER